jgi:hypothetical protein
MIGIGSPSLRANDTVTKSIRGRRKRRAAAELLQIRTAAMAIWLLFASCCCVVCLFAAEPGQIYRELRLRLFGDQLSNLLARWLST